MPLCTAVSYTKTGCRKTGNGADTRLPACSWFYDDMALHLITLLVLSYTVVDTGCSFITFYPASLAENGILLNKTSFCL